MDEAEGLDRMGSIGWVRWADGPGGGGGGGRASSGTRHLHAMRIWNLHDSFLLRIDAPIEGSTMSRAGLVVPFSVRGNLTQDGLALVALVHVHVDFAATIPLPPVVPNSCIFCPRPGLRPRFQRLRFLRLAPTPVQANQTYGPHFPNNPSPPPSPPCPTPCSGADTVQTS